jgi:hypothetical protein
MKINLKRLGNTLFSLGVATFICGAMFDEYLNVNSPRAKSAFNGYVFALFNHGSVVYITKFQHYISWIFSFGPFVIGLLGIVAMLIANKPNLR